MSTGILSAQALQTHSEAEMQEPVQMKKKKPICNMSFIDLICSHNTPAHSNAINCATLKHQGNTGK